MSATTLAYVPSFTAQTDTNDLIAAHLAGDERAFTRLVTRYQPRLVNFVTRMIQDRERAEDLVQEAFLRVYRHLNRFDPSRKFSTWVYTIARNLRIDHHRRQPGMAVALPDDWDAEQQPADAHLTPDELLQAAQRERGVQQALAELPAEQARVLRLSFFDEQPHSRIAQELGIPLGTVKSRIRLAAAQLRRLLERHQA